MRAELKKCLFLGTQDRSDLFFQAAQEWGVIHFAGKALGKSPYSSAIQKTAAALKLTKGEERGGDQHQIVERLLELKTQMDAVEANLQKLDKALVFAHFFGDDALKDLQEVERYLQRKAYFYWAPHAIFEAKEGFILVNSDLQRDYFLVLSKEPPTHPKLHEVPLHDLSRQKELKQELILLRGELLQLSSYRSGLQHYLTDQKNAASKWEAASKALKIEGDLFIAEGWVPEEEVGPLKKKVEGLGFQLHPVAPEENETPPTLLDNNLIGQMGEDLVNIYDTPSATDKDPSLWVIAFFALFFAFIIGDGGYGLLFLSAALFIRWKYSLGQAGLRAWRIITTVSAACVVWGILTTSFFGIPIAQDSPLRKVSLLQWVVEKKLAYSGISDPQGALLQDEALYTRQADPVMLELALLIGVVHLSISLLRYAQRNPPSVGWLIFLWSATLYLPIYLKVDSLLHYVFHIPPSIAAWGLYGMGVGVALATSLSLIKNKWLGLLEPTTLIQVFGDSMSYLRLYALALSGSMMTSALLELSASTPLVAGPLILIFGHLVNIVLSIMGGTIHGLRLNFLEWYHYSFEGGGKPYTPLRRII